MVEKRRSIDSIGFEPSYAGVRILGYNSIAFAESASFHGSSQRHTESVQSRLGRAHRAHSAFGAGATFHRPAFDPRGDQPPGISDAPRPGPQGHVPRADAGHRRPHHSDAQ